MYVVFTLSCCSFPSKSYNLAPWLVISDVSCRQVFKSSTYVYGIKISISQPKTPCL